MEIDKILNLLFSVICDKVHLHYLPWHKQCVSICLWFFFSEIIKNVFFVVVAIIVFLAVHARVRQWGKQNEMFVRAFIDVCILKAVVLVQSYEIVIMNTKEFGIIFLLVVTNIWQLWLSWLKCFFIFVVNFWWLWWFTASNIKVIHVPRFKIFCTSLWRTCDWQNIWVCLWVFTLICFVAFKFWVFLCVLKPNFYDLEDHMAFWLCSPFLHLCCCHAHLYVYPNLCGRYHHWYWMSTLLVQ